MTCIIHSMLIDDWWLCHHLDHLCTGKISWFETLNSKLSFPLLYCFHLFFWDIWVIWFVHPHHIICIPVLCVFVTLASTWHLCYCCLLIYMIDMTMIFPLDTCCFMLFLTTIFMKTAPLWSTISLVQIYKPFKCF